ncbi:class I SAM-dependent methyltransferase [Flavobacteriaceae bacterium F89]|uniref:Class I SAM-dependent methyltransferase n=1 Tax=Cerina litoralis TaxID=2874477 RepID=A0AAE3JNA5_9FLAO|nr:class I SAM-dependent methyltransferase [Cerina litoralis]MCG2459674.1 class I SAM-dependent methyltransferase [Cerina litoralis]
MNTDIMSVLLHKASFDGLSLKELAQQIEAKKKCKDKLPLWFSTPNIYYPERLNLEQASSEITAAYKSEKVNGRSLVDLTGGFGVDSYFFSEKLDRVFHCEIDEDLSDIAAHNFLALGAKNIISVKGDGIEFVKQSKVKFDWIFLDPSRRHKSKGKVFLLSDCLPNVPENLDHLFDKSDRVLIKTSPMLDLSAGLKELREVLEIHVVAAQNEVKELLWFLRKGATGKVSIHTVNFGNSGTESFNFDHLEEKEALSSFGFPAKYLYEPNAAILKSGGFKIVGSRFGLSKLHEHSHVYTSDILTDFPGRRFQILEVVPYTKRTIQKLNLDKANITTRNFPESVAGIRKKFKIKEGGDIYLFFTKDRDGKLIALRCKKV